MGFANAREAKEYLIGQILEEASREGIELSEIERKMLYFSETHWTLPDIDEVNESFDRDYDQKRYEKKIAELARGARKNRSTDSNAWSDAIRLLRSEDHYLLVMID